MYTASDFHDYQLRFAEFIQQTPYCIGMIDMGLGKTAGTALALSEMLACCDAERILISAPKRVADIVWPEELHLWKGALTLDLPWRSLREKHILEPKNDNDKHSFAELKRIRRQARETLQRTGWEKGEVLNAFNRTNRRIARLQREQILALPGPVHIINVDNIPWLVRTVGNHWPYDTVVTDESSGYKSHASERFKALKKVRPLIRRMIQLTGTPTSNDLRDLWAQVFLLDQGERLGPSFGDFEAQYFHVDRYTYQCEPRSGAEEEIFDLIGDLVFALDGSEKLPPVIDNPVWVEMPSKARGMYEELRKELVAEWGPDFLEVPGALVLANKLLQICNGAVYGEDKKVLIVHDEKLKALQEIVETHEHKPLLVVYEFKHERERIRKQFPQAVALDDYKEAWRDFDKGKIPMLLMHAKSGGHGLNIQHSTNMIVMYGVTHSYEMVRQVSARLARQGQKEDRVVVHHILCRNTVERKYAIEKRAAKAETAQKLKSAMVEKTRRHICTQ